MNRSYLREQHPVQRKQGRALDGASILPLFRGKTIRRPHPLYWQYDFAISQPWEVSMRDGPWKLLANKTLDQFELYNVVDDIGEAKNLAGWQPERVRKWPRCHLCRGGAPAGRADIE